MDKDIFGVYIRVSTDQQAALGDSIEMQKNLAKNLIEKEGGVLYKIYVEEGVSATKTDLKDRVKLMECLKDIENGLINNLVAYRRDRLARKTEDSLAIRKILQDNKCSMHFTATGEQQMEFDDPYSKLMENIRSSLDEIESAQTSIRVSDTMFDKAKRGEFSGGNVTYGYENVNGYLKPIENQIDLLKEVEDMYLEGYGVHSIVRWLEGEHVRNKGKRHTKATKVKQHRNSTSNWTKDNVTAILFNPTYSGYMRYTKKLNDENETINVLSPYIVPTRTKEKQEKINKERNKRNSKISPPRRYSTSFLLTGILICEECGRDYASRTVTKSNGQKYAYYICKGRYSHNASICKSKIFKKEIIEQFILEEAKKYVQEFIDSDVHLRVKKEVEKKDRKLTEKLDEVATELVKKEKDFQSMSRLLLDLDTEGDMYENMRDLYQEQQRSVLKQVNILKETKLKIEEELELKIDNEIDMGNIVEELKDFNHIVEFSPIHLQKQLLEKLFSKIEISKNGELTFYVTFEIDKVSTTVDFTSVGDIVQVNDKSIMLNGGVGDPITPKNITMILNEKSYSVSYFKWLELLTKELSGALFKFITYHNSEFNNVDYFIKYTGLTRSMLREYRVLERLPSFEVLKRMLDVSNLPIELLIEKIRKKGINCNRRIIEVVLNDNNIIKRNIKRGKES